MGPKAPRLVRVTQQIGEAIKGQIASGLLGPGARLPSTRALATEWGVSRTTVTAAYEQLIAEGYLEARQGALTRVAAGLGPAPAASDPVAPTDQSDRLSAYGKRLSAFALPPLAEGDRMIADFRYGDVAAADFPVIAWRKAVGNAVLRRQERLCQRRLKSDPLHAWVPFET
jgi:GntR family transcriptional regulator/MocR family aminotransferase